jgi:hypothetical protein
LEIGYRALYEITLAISTLGFFGFVKHSAPM